MLAIEEMARQQLAKDETNQKRIQAKLQKDKNPHMKELLQRVDDISESNEEFQKKLREESEKYDALKDELISRKETLRLACEKNTETEDRLSVQAEELNGMSSDIKTKQVGVDEQVTSVEDMRKTNLFEEEKNRK